MIGILGYCPEAEDIGQETFIRFYKSLSKFRGDSSIGTYLTRIAINLSYNEIKRRQKKQKLFASEPESRIVNHPFFDKNPQNRETRRIVQRGLQQLEPKFRAVLVLRLIQGYSTEETAKILKLPIGTVLSRLARAQMKLKKILSPFFKEKKNDKIP